MPSRQIDDRKAPMTEPDTGLHVVAVIVWASVALNVVHPHESRAIDVASPARREDSRYRTHGSYPPSPTDWRATARANAASIAGPMSAAKRDSAAAACASPS